MEAERRDFRGDFGELCKCVWVGGASGKADGTRLSPSLSSVLYSVSSGRHSEPSSNLQKTPEWGTAQTEGKQAGAEKGDISLQARNRTHGDNIRFSPKRLMENEQRSVGTQSSSFISILCPFLQAVPIPIMT